MATDSSWLLTISMLWFTVRNSCLKRCRIPLYRRPLKHPPGNFSFKLRLWLIRYRVPVTPKFVQLTRNFMIAASADLRRLCLSGGTATTPARRDLESVTGDLADQRTSSDALAWKSHEE